MSEYHPGELELLAYAEGELDPNDAAAAHIAACAECAARVRLLEDARTALRAAPLLEFPAERRGRLLGSLPERRRERRFALPPRALAAVAALALVATALALAVLGVHGSGGPGSAASPQKERNSSSGASSAAGGSTVPAATDLTAGPTPARLAQALRARGFDARAREGRVVVRGAPRTSVRKALTALSPGSVPVVVKP